MRSNSAPPGIIVGLVLLVGVLAASTAALFIRLAYAAEGSGSVGLGLLLAAPTSSLSSCRVMGTPYPLEGEEGI